jgi:hypothetical protein
VARGKRSAACRQRQVADREHRAEAEIVYQFDEFVDSAVADSLTAKGKRRAQRSQRVRSKDRNRVGSRAVRVGVDTGDTARSDRDSAASAGLFRLRRGSGGRPGRGRVVDARFSALVVVLATLPLVLTPGTASAEEPSDYLAVTGAGCSSPETATSPSTEARPRLRSGLNGGAWRTQDRQLGALRLRGNRLGLVFV